MQATIRIKGYDGLERLALGKRTAVYSVHRSRHKQPVVVKVLLPHLMGDRRFLTRFEKSVRLAMGIRQENTVNVLDYGRSDTAAYVVAERYTGAPLQEILAEQHRIPTDIALSIVLQVCRALEAAHAVGLIHRDVRPANIILTDDGVVKLADFALATDIGENGRVTHAGRVTATPAYMSPEQTLGQELTPQTDIFSLGAVAFELLTGRRAFGSGDFGQIVERIQNNVVPAAGSINPLLEPAIERVVGTMLQKDRAKRYGHASELLMDLEEAMGKYAYRVDAGNMAAFAMDPPAFFDEFARRMIERVVARAPVRDGDRAAGRAARVRYYQKLLFLDPHDEGARRELAALQRDAANSGGGQRERGVQVDSLSSMRGALYANLDPNALYRVVLESIDTERDNEASFALRLSMKLRTPLPRVKSFVKKMPARVSDHMSYADAMRLARIIEELGGHVRLDVCPDAAPKPDARTAPDPTAGDARSCPRCGWVGEGEAEFCEVCLHRFNEPATVTFQQLRGALPDENPLADGPRRGNPVLAHWQTIMALPRWMRLVALAAFVAIVVAVAIR